MNKFDSDFDNNLSFPPFKKQMFSKQLMDHVEQKIKTTERKSTWKLRTLILSSLSIFILLSLLFGINELMYKKNLPISTNKPIPEQIAQIKNYQVTLPKDWSVKESSSLVFSFNKNLKDIGGMDVLAYDRNQPISQLVANHTEVIESKQESGFFTDVIRMKIKYTQPAASGDPSTVELTHFYFIAKYEGIAYDLYFNSADVSEETAVRIAKSVVPRKPFGIFKESEGAGFLDTNIGTEWHGMVDNKYFELFAGAVRDNLEQGNIILVIEKSEIPYSDEKSGIKNTNGSLNYGYLTPSKHGSVEIIKENDGKITLKAKDGTIFVFDIRNRSYE